MYDVLFEHVIPEAVVAHEVSHVAGGDMVTLTLIQGVVNTFVIFMAKVLAGIVDNFLSSDEEDQSGHSWTYFILDMVFQMIFGILASVTMANFSRKCEFVADAGAAKLVGADKMRSALKNCNQIIHHNYKVQ